MNEKQIIRFIKGFDRMCDSFGEVDPVEGDECSKDCPFYDEIDKIREEELDPYIPCFSILSYKPEMAVPIVLKWMQENPERTRMVDFIEKHPKAPLNANGYPKACAKKCGYVPEHKVCRAICAACWETDVEEED